MDKKDGCLKVDKWIKLNFDLTSVQIFDFEWLPCGKKIKDKAGQEMVVFWDFVSEKVRFVYPD